MISNNSSLICIEKDCKLNRVITNWNDLQIHYQNKHKVYPLDKFEKKVHLKLNQFNQKFRKQIEENISQLIAQQEQEIIERVKTLYQDFEKICYKILHEQTNVNEKLEGLFSNNQQESVLQKYIDIYYSQIRSPQQYQVERLLDEFQYKLNGITNDLLHFIYQVEQSQNLESLNNFPQKNQDFEYQSHYYFNQQMKMQQKQYNYEYPQQENNFVAQLQEQDDQNNIPLRNYKYIRNQQQYYSQKDSLQQSQQQQLSNSAIPLEEQQQKNQYTAYFPKSEMNTDNDRIKFQLPSETIYNQKNNNLKDRLDNFGSQKQIQNDTLNQIQEDNQYKIQDDNQNKIQEDNQNKIQEDNQNKIQEDIQNNDLNQSKLKSRQNQEYEIKQNLQKQNQQIGVDEYIVNDETKDNKAQKKINIVGKKFDITNSDKHLKYSLRFTQFSCVQQGVALVEGAFTLNDNAKVKFKLTERFDKVLTASFGIQNVDNQGKKLGTLNFFMDQSGLLFKNEKQRQGSLKIGLNEELILSYRAEKRLLMFRKQETAEYLHIEGSISGCFKFYVKLYGLQVQIIK
ncbi:unnamed protein product [Paramecium sonneborni]|uniref:Uncharacterized protein n=1 Tax=Paramecium sonneborni TaxID=65129 RepID=A0A8S1KY54_9CILI|nr:unnamed protein product [Paramecium sonneborni]